MRRVRFLIALTLSVVIGGNSLAVPPASAGPAKKDVETIVSRLQEYYLDQGDEIRIANGIYLGRMSEALQYAESMAADGSWSDVDYTDTTSSANGAVWSAYIALYRMVAMAQAYREPTANGYRDPAVLSALERALRYWDSADPTNKNWWETEIGESIAMGRISLFVGDVLSQDALDVALRHNTGKLDPVGANGAWRTTNYLFEALATSNGENLRAGLDTMVRTVTPDNSGAVREAVQPDASFWAHGAQLYSEGYGMILFVNVALWADAARGTRFAFSRDNLDTIANYIVNGTRWMIRGEIGMLYLGYRPPKTIDGVTSHSSEFIEPLTKMIRTDPLYASAYRALLDSIHGKTTSNGLAGNKYFWRSEFSSHLRDDYGIFTRLNSSRTVGSEYRSTFRPEIGNEIVWNSAGATAIQVNNHEYSDLGPAFDWFHYPGVTAPYVKEQTLGSTGNGGAFTGGVSDGTYGASVHSLDRAATKGNKSYYYFDDEMVALGSGITSAADAAVHTTVNQASAKDNASVDGKPVPAGTDSVAVDHPSWAYNDEVGYVFPTEQRVHVSNKAQTGSWLDADPVSRDAFTLYVDHGVKPDDAGYEYVVLPAKTPEQVKAYAADPAVEVLRNDTEVQAVRHAGLRRTMATFYRAGRLDLGAGRSLEVSQPSIVILNESGDTPLVSVANPNLPGLVVRVTLTDVTKAAHGSFALGDGANLGRTVTAELVPIRPGDRSDYTASTSAADGKAAFAGDGNEATAWHSVGDGTAWLSKELESGSFLTGVSVAWGDDAATRYLLQTSLDGKTWTDRRFVRDGTGGRVDLEMAPTPATYVRLLMIDSTGRRGYSVKEFGTVTSINRALGKPVTASGSSGGTPGNVTDGSMSTRWSANSSDTAWVQVDLGAAQRIRAVRLWWEASYAKQYAIRVSDDGQTWRDAFVTSGAGSDGGTDLVTVDETARYVRMQSQQRSTSHYGVSLWEMELFEDDRVTDAPPASAGRENLALHRPISADSTYNATLASANANDGNPVTRWASERQAAPYTTERWLQVDLEETRSVSQVIVTWEAATSNDYRIEASVNGQDWTVLARVQKTSGELRNVVDVGRSEARYVRVAGLPATQYGLSIFEFEVYGGYTLRCHATPFRVAPNSTAVATGTISPRDPDDEVGVESLDENVVSIAGTPRVDADGRIDVDLTTGSSGSTSLLFTHTKGDEYVLCPVTFTVTTSKLERLVKRANTLESERYTPSSWRPLLPALEAAKATLRSTDLTQPQADAAATALAEAIIALHHRAGHS
ncbi:discoidin domain-containing protein [Kribbella shirazensis]|uniref:Chondroitin AC lyase n=1 Tax=Kribbella shirazensis TaxID=1105143 RepID=A0A7X6A4I0_9ACTN|nr:polysaccharide lyase family 8 super-sandwich domain-containing protein [Kribbella shirazensis]NIK61532.1 chondroitin AC lyase [Kribbella shirazensis]